MNRINKPRALIADSVGIITRAAEKFIAKGWDVDVAESAMELFELIDKSKNSPYALVISGHRVSGTDGPDILEKVAAVSPMTQRMLILPSEETGLLMQAINRAGIHACMTSPFLPEELVSRAEICCRDFLDTVKNTRFRRLIELQNRQLYETAQELKKKRGEIMICWLKKSHYC